MKKLIAVLAIGLLALTSQAWAGMYQVEGECSLCGKPLSRWAESYDYSYMPMVTGGGATHFPEITVTLRVCEECQKKYHERFNAVADSLKDRIRKSNAALIAHYENEKKLSTEAARKARIEELELRIKLLKEGKDENQVSWQGQYWRSSVTPPPTVLID